MCFFNGYDMADRDAYEAGYSHRRSRRSSFDITKTRDYKLGNHMRRNIKRGVWFTGEPIAELTDDHLANCIALSKRKDYYPYIDALEAEQARRATRRGE